MSGSSTRSRDLALTATFAAFIAVLGLVPAFSPFGFAVPITLQSLGIMLVGAVLGPRHGAGYLVGFPISAAVIGYLIYRHGAPYNLPYALAAIIFGGIVVLYLIGVPVTAWRADISLRAADDGSGVFIGGDLIKAVLAAIIAGAVHRADPRLLPRRRG